MRIFIVPGAKLKLYFNIPLPPTFFRKNMIPWELSRQFVQGYDSKGFAMQKGPCWRQPRMWPFDLFQTRWCCLAPPPRGFKKFVTGSTDLASRAKTALKRRDRI